MLARTSAASSPSTETGRPAFALDSRARRLEGGQLLLGGEPPRLIRLSDKGTEALDGLLSGETVVDETGPLAERLVRAGVLHPLPEAKGAGSDAISVVVPVRDPPATFGALVGSLLSGGAAVTVVDDGSAPKSATAIVAVEERGARIVRRPVCGGPAAARNAAAIDTDLVAFLDADTVLDPDRPLHWMATCLAHFADPKVGLVAPRVRTLSQPVALGRGLASSVAALVASYETAESPLDFGPEPGQVGAGRRLSYVPATAIVVRRRALEEVGGFDEQLRYGEDVDLVRRLEAAGWVVRYEPRSEVGHLPRPSLGSFARQRFGYGTAAAALDARHAGSVAPYAATLGPSLVTASVVVAALSLRRPKVLVLSVAAGVASAAATAVALGSRLKSARCPSPGVVASQLVATSCRSCLSGTLTAVRRAWWPLLLPFALSRRGRRRVLALLTAAELAGHGRPLVAAARAGERPGALEMAARLLTGALDDVAYGSGVLAGCVSARSARALGPQLRWRRTAPRG